MAGFLDCNGLDTCISSIAEMLYVLNTRSKFVFSFSLLISELTSCAPRTKSSKGFVKIYVKERSFSPARSRPLIKAKSRKLMVCIQYMNRKALLDFNQKRENMTLDSYMMYDILLFIKTLMHCLTIWYYLQEKRYVILGSISSNYWGLCGLFTKEVFPFWYPEQSDDLLLLVVHFHKLGQGTIHLCFLMQY